MSDPEEELRAIRKAHDAYELSRRELHDDLQEMDPDQFDETLSLAEELGARHVRSLLQQRTERKIEASLGDWFDRLEHRLQRYIDSSSDLDSAVAVVEERRFAEGQSPEKQTLAFHGEFPVVDFVNKTVTFPGREPEPLVLTEGRGPEPLEPERDQSRSRQRGRGR
jgi:hypothetical protein